MKKNNGDIPLRQCAKIMNNSCDGIEALEFVKEISAFHRIQASGGYRAAAAQTMRILREKGLEASIHSYPADG